MFVGLLPCCWLLKKPSRLRQVAQAAESQQGSQQSCSLLHVDMSRMLACPSSIMAQGQTAPQAVILRAICLVCCCLAVDASAAARCAG
jgi:hypothetical protein